MSGLEFWSEVIVGSVSGSPNLHFPLLYPVYLQYMFFVQFLCSCCSIIALRGVCTAEPYRFQTVFTFSLPDEVFPNLLLSCSHICDKTFSPNSLGCFMLFHCRCCLQFAASSSCLCPFQFLWVWILHFGILWMTLDLQFAHSLTVRC